MGCVSRGPSGLLSLFKARESGNMVVISDWGRRGEFVRLTQSAYETDMGNSWTQIRVC